MRILNPRLIFCLTAAGLMASCAGSPGAKVSTVEASFIGGIGSYDQNRDGIVTCDEWRAAAGRLFTKANKSGSDFLTGDEFQNLVAIDRTFLATGFKYYDVNGDGKIDKKEFVERPNPAFGYADKDQDCRLTEAEQVAARSLLAKPSETASRHSVATTGVNPAVPTTNPGGRY